MAIEGEIQALLSPLVDERVYPLVAPQGTPAPYIAYTVVSNRAEVTLDGPNGLEGNRLQLDVYATTYGAAKSVARQVVNAMNGAGHVPLVGPHDLHEPETQLFRVSMDFSVWAQ